MKNTTDYRAPILTIDGVIMQLIDGKLCVLLIQRQHEPFKNQWALPGSYNAEGETTTQALERTLKRKAGVSVKKLSLVEQLYTFDTVARDPRGHAVSITYLGLGKGIVPLADKVTENPTFFAVSDLPKLAYDHEKIVTYAHQRLASKITYTNAAYALLPKLFTLTQLQTVYEEILGHSLDKRNFRKKYLSLGLITATDQRHSEGAHRPATLYTFNKQSLEALSRSFD